MTYTLRHITQETPALRSTSLRELAAIRSRLNHRGWLIELMIERKAKV